MKKTCPYTNLPEYSYWRRSVGASAPDVDIVLSAPFKITPKDKVVTAGSCFAQHIARWLKEAGFNYFVAETGSGLPRAIAQRYGYGVFSARYGNIYTTRQLKQLFDRAYGNFIPEEQHWSDDIGLRDPFRPFIQPVGFGSLEEAKAEQEGHFRAVRRLFEEADYFVFTLGLTEAWESVTDGAVFPVCPGCGAGVFDSEKYRFKNFSAAEVRDDMLEFIKKLRGVNPRVKVILTVSPVPLIATMEDRSVVVSTAYSKAALRVAAEEVCSTGLATYFPSYEMITSNYTKGGHFADDWREVRESGVSFVMKTFLKYYCEPPEHGAPRDARHLSEVASQIICDEENLDS